MQGITEKEYKSIQNMAWSLLKREKISRMDIEDIIQESAICLDRQKRNRRDDISIGVIILSRFQDFMSIQKKHEINCSGGDMLNRILPEEYATINTKDILLRKVVDELPEYERMIIIEYYYNGYTLAEIAEMVGKSSQGVSGDKARALRLLRRMINRLPYGIE